MGMAELVTGEIYENWRNLCKRRVVAQRIGFAGSDVVRSLSFPADGVSPIDGGTFPNSGLYRKSYWTYPLWLRSAFLGYNGGTAHIIDYSSFAPNNLNTTTNTMTVCMGNTWTGQDAGVNTFFDLINGGSGMQFFPNTSFGEIGCPNRSNYAFKYAFNKFELDEGLFAFFQHLVITFTFPFTGGNIDHVLVYQAALDDFNFGGFLCAPRVVAKN